MNSDPAELHGRVPSARRHDDGDDVATDTGLRLSTDTEVEYGGGGTAHGWNRSTDQLVCLEVPPCPRI